MRHLVSTVKLTTADGATIKVDLGERATWRFSSSPVSMTYDELTSFIELLYETQKIYRWKSFCTTDLQETNQ